MKRNIIRLMTLCTVAVLALASCKKDNKPQGNVPENGFLATVEANQGNGGRTHLVGGDVLWNAGDQIVVRNGNGATATYRLTSGENTTEGTFLSSEDDNEFFQPTYTAVYPATGNTVTGEGTATITLPATQAYVANSFANGAMPMMAVSDEQTLAFKNMLGGICFPMVGDNLNVTRLVLTSNNTADHLSGVFAADYNNGEPTLTYTSGGANSITLDCGAGVTLDATTATDFIIMVPAGSLANGFKLEAYNGEEKVFEKTNDATLGTDFISRSAIKKVNNALEVVNTQFTGLTFEAKTAGSTVTFTAGDLSQVGMTVPTLEYSTDGETWNEYTSGAAITLANVGDKVMFRGDNETLGYSAGFYWWYGYDEFYSSFSYDDDGIVEVTVADDSDFLYSNFSTTGECYVYGNVMSLLDKEDYATATVVPGCAFMRLFMDNRSIYNHPEHPIELPATTLGEYCYTGMFAGCTSLTAVPALPATTLANYCYELMFFKCFSLTAPPELPAATLAVKCYSGMFYGCTSLTTAPELSAMTLADDCYSYMFMCCTSLTTAPELPATTLAEYCYGGMFQLCTSLTTAPELLVTTLSEYYGEYYSDMFRFCTNLNYVKCLAICVDRPGAPGHCVRDWLRGVAPTGTLVKHPSMNWPNSEWHGNGLIKYNIIPEGWTVVDAEL